MAKHIRQKDMPDVTPVSNTHRNDATKDSHAFKEHYDPFADPFNDEEEFARFQEAEAETYETHCSYRYSALYYRNNRFRILFR